MNFEQIFSLISKDERVLLSRDRARCLYDCAQDALRVDGEYWETGVFQGGSARMLAEVLRGRDRTLRLFDTFEGFKGLTQEDGDFGHIGWFSNTSLEMVKQFVDADFAFYYPGLVPETFAGLEGSKIAFAHLDTDLYEPIKAALEFVLPRLSPNGIIVVDDYGDSNWPGVRAAVCEAFDPKFPVNLYVRKYGEHDCQAVIR